MKIVVAPDSFKGSSTAKQVADAIEKGLRRVVPSADIVKVPMADGGEGTTETLVDATGGEYVNLKVTGPLGRVVNAHYGILGDRKTAVIEMASASGLQYILADQRNPMIATSFGTGQLIKHALEAGCRNFIIGLGGSATNDGGVGMAQALGVRFTDKNGNEIGFGGEELSKIHKIDVENMDYQIKESIFIIASDVDNPLCGSTGASAVFGPQKGATPEMIEILDNNLAHMAERMKSCLGKDIASLPGSGAAGGMGSAMLAFFDATMKKGVNVVIEATGLEEIIKDASLVFTGEGRIDTQILHGKTPYGVALVAKKYNIPVVAIAGGIREDAYSLFDYGIDSIESIVDKPMDLESCMNQSEILISRAAERVMRSILISIQ